MKRRHGDHKSCLSPSHNLAASLPVTTIVPSHIIFSATNCKHIKQILLMHVTPLLGYCTADFPEYLSSAFLTEAKLASSCASSQIPSQKWKCRSCKMQLYPPHSSLPVFHRPFYHLLSKSLRFKTLTVTLPFIPKVHWKCLNIYMSESASHETNIYDYIRAPSQLYCNILLYSHSNNRKVEPAFMKSV